MTEPNDGDTDARSRRRVPKPVTVKRLENAAATYVARYDAPAPKLRAVLMRRVVRARRDDAPVVDAVESVIDTIVARYTTAGIVDDGRYAERKAGSLHRRGVSTAHIREKLRLAGIGRDLVERALEATRAETAADDGVLNLRAAVALARRRRLGPFRAAGERRERRNRDLAALGRAGFDFDIARRVIDADDPDALIAPEAGR